MPKYCGKQIFAHGRFPEVGQNQKKEKRETGVYKVPISRGRGIK